MPFLIRSLVTPLLVDGKLVYGTKMGATGITSDVQTFVDARPQFRYNDLSYRFLPLRNRMKLS